MIRFAEDRFPIFDHVKGIDGPADRYTIVDTKAWDAPYQGKWYSYAGFDEDPYNPTGIGMHSETAHRFWDDRGWLAENKRITFHDLPPKARQFAQRFMESVTWHGGEPDFED